MEPQSTGLFILLLAVFCALLACVALARQPVFRVLAASLAFLPAMLFGVAAVNKYYDYYQTWGAAAADLAGQGLSTAASLPSGAPAQRLTAILGAGDQHQGRGPARSDLRITGRRRPATEPDRLVFLPPQYFRPRSATTASRRSSSSPAPRGSPRTGSTWWASSRPTKRSCVSAAVQPVALVMPDPNGGPQISLQCLNVVGGPQDATYLARDVPNYLSRTLRLQPSGRAWGIAGYSEGGYCAANLALRYPGRYGYAGVLSGYFAPSQRPAGPPLADDRPVPRQHRAP